MSVPLTVLRATLLLVAAVLVPGCRAPAPRADDVATDAVSISASFRLWDTTYHVGEPIVVELTVVNAGATTFSFDEGGDHRWAGGRSERYSFRVESSMGRVFTTPPHGNWGGVMRRIALEPGQRFRSWQLLNASFHLLPPGQYALRCDRTLSRDGEAGPEGPFVDVKQDLSFTIQSYSKRAIIEQIGVMQSTDTDSTDALRLFGVPVSTAIQDLREKLWIQVPEATPRSKVSEAVLHELPEQWDDQYYVAYDVTASRNRVTTERPEPLVITLVARNAGDTALPHRLAQSTLSMNGDAVPRWTNMVRAATSERRLPDRLAAGASIELTIALGGLIPPAKEVTIEWTLDNLVQRDYVPPGQ